MRIKISDCSSWPDPRNDLSWTLRYGKPTPEDLLNAAAYVEAYQEMTLRLTRDRRDLVCRELRAAADNEEGRREVIQECHDAVAALEDSWGDQIVGRDDALAAIDGIRSDPHSSGE